jgi:hypothetical protein
MKHRSGVMRPDIRDAIVIGDRSCFGHEIIVGARRLLRPRNDKAFKVLSAGGFVGARCTRPRDGASIYIRLWVGTIYGARGQFTWDPALVGAESLLAGSGVVLGAAFASAPGALAAEGSVLSSAFG